MPILDVTKSAAAQIKRAEEAGEMKGLALRLAPFRKEDGSIEYNKMGFDEIKKDDVHIHSEGVDVVFKSKYKELLEGTIMDFVEIEDGHHSFIFLNPNDPHYVEPKEKK